MLGPKEPAGRMSVMPISISNHMRASWLPQKAPAIESLAGILASLIL